MQAGAQFHLRHGSYRGQRLAAKTHGVQVEEVVGLSYFRSGMPLEREAGIGGRHALPVVYHLNRGAPGIHHDDIDMAGTGIEGILHQFLHHRSRPLYHLAGCYLIGYRIG